MVYDLIILGGGPAGYIAAERAGHFGKKVLLIEKNNLGGVCLNEGCIPTKTLLYSSKLKDSAANGKKYGVETAEVLLNHKRVLARKSKTIKKLVAGIKMQLDKCSVEIIEGEGYIERKTDEGFKISVDGNIYLGNHLLIATGSSTIIIPIEGMDKAIEDGFAITNKEVLELKDIPEKMAVVGGGVIGLEIASYFQSAGSQVTIIEMLDKIGGNIDEEIAEILKSECEKQGIEFVLGAKVSKIENSRVYYEKDGDTNEIICDKALLSVGRRANISGYGLENLNVETDKGIITNDEMKTNIDGVYAAGDVTAALMLAHVAYRQAEVAVNNILGIKDNMEYSAIPSVIYTNPEVASVGISKKQADDIGMETIEKSISMNYSGRYMAENEAGQGIAKIIVQKHSSKLIGVQIIGSYASEIIYGAGIMIEQGMTTKDIKRQVFPHPTVAEIIREAVFMIDEE
ncbi:MAG: dihydrolipoyl dehydrogenase [Eubacteriales bacterium]